MAVFGIFWHFLGFSGDLGILIVLVNYEVTRGIILVVGRVTDGFWGGSRGFWGDLGGSGGVCFTPIEHILPLWKSCMAPDLVPNTKYWSN